jgi:predicted Rossmann fold flavoprotein
MADGTRIDNGPWDAVIVGAGAAGLMAAIVAAERGRRVLLLEKNSRPGIKILMSGGTRCNITQATDNRGITLAFGPSGRFLHSALAALGVEEAVALFEAEGVATKVEETGKIFPVSNKAADVLAALLARLRRSGATLALSEPVTGLERTASGFAVSTPNQNRVVARIVLTTGGQSYPGSGTTGDGYRFAASLGHRIVPPRPALVPLTVAANWVAGLRGITLPDVAMRILDGGETLATRRGSLLFAHFGLTGPVALDVSRAVSGHPEPGRLVAQIDLLPQMSDSDLDAWIREHTAAAGKKQLAVILGSLLPRRLVDVLVPLVGLAPDRVSAGLKKEERLRLATVCKRLDVPLTGTLGFKKAEVTAGGVALDEVDSKTMQSKLVPGLFLAGEILDLDGPIGGFNFQAAWSTGWLAGSWL